MSDDLIKRSDAIKAVAKYISCDYPTIDMAEDDARDLIDQIPSAQGRYIDADALVTVYIYDHEHEDDYTECMSVEKCLDLLTEEGCPKTADRPQGEWVKSKTPKEFRDRMEELSHLNTESRHIEMDACMCDLLTELGYGEGVEIFNSVALWYS